MKKIIILLFMLVIVFCGKKSIEPTEPTSTGTVKGYVYETGTSSPISGVIVSIGSVSDTTVSNGYYELNDIPTGNQTITANADSGYYSYFQTITVNKGDNQHNIYLTATLPISPEMVFVPAGNFQMGDNFNEGDSWEKPVHTVYLDAYYIGKYEVTNEQYCQFLNEEGNQSEGGSNWLDINDTDCLIEESGGVYSTKSGKANHPVIEVSWYGARAYCTWLTNTTGHTHRLPTEAEWEKAARGDAQLNQVLGHQRRFPWGDNIDGSYANYQNSGDPFETGCYPWTTPGTTPVGYYDGSTHESFSTNDNSSPYGAYDMAGNVYEWCHDWYSSDYYSSSPPTNPVGPSAGSHRVVRGGYWFNYTYYLRSAYRYYGFPYDTGTGAGFRCLREY